MRGRLGVLLILTALLAVAFGGTAGLLPADGSAAAARRRLPSYLSLGPQVHQLVTVTSPHWSSTRGTLRAWRLREGSWWLVHGPVRVRLGWSGWVPAHRRHQDSGTTPAGSFRLRYAFGNRRDPGTALRYRHVDGNDMWPYEPRDKATYNIYQPFLARTSHWRRDYRERLSDYPRQYAYAVVIGFNLPSGVHWSRSRHQWVARRPADTSRGGGIFLHVQGAASTAGCVAGPLRDIRWVVRWLRPAARPRIEMGPRRWLERRF